MEVPQKIKYRITMGSSKSTFGYKLKRTESRNTERIESRCTCPVLTTAASQ